MEVQHLFTPAHWRVIGGLMLLNRQQNGAKMGQKQRQKQNEAVRAQEHCILIIQKVVEDTDTS
jgi:hypothetical protein